MARRADHSHSELLDLVIEASTKIVESESHHALTARRLSKDIGYSVGTLYNHFDNIDDIILQVNARTFDILSEKLEHVPLTNSPKNDTNAYVDCYLEFLNQHPELWRMIFEHNLPHGQEAPSWYLKKADYILSIYERAIMPLYGGPCKSSYNTTRVLWSSLHGITSLHVSGKLKNVTELSVKGMTETLVNNFIQGIEQDVNS